MWVGLEISKSIQEIGTGMLRGDVEFVLFSELVYSEISKDTWNNDM